jgi:putative nucleotidyltransferase with HDIG domain
MAALDNAFEEGWRQGTLAMPGVSPHILVVDDEAALLRMMDLMLRRMRLVCQTAASLADARALLADARYDIVLLDLSLPDGKGTMLLDQLRAMPVPPVVVIITGQRELATAISVIRGGAFDFIPKPFSVEEFQERVERAVIEWRSREQATSYRDHLERLVHTMTGRLDDASVEIEHTYDMTVAALGAALDLRDPETEEHCRRVAECSVRLGVSLGLDGSPLRNLRWGAYLHDIGKIGIAERILLKTSGLSDEEMQQVKVHPQLGYQMISRIEFLKEACEVVLYHHEKYDGSGYPFGLKAEQIPMAARIFAVTDTLDAMTYDRPYRKALPFGVLAAELRALAGIHFDPRIVARFLEFPPEHWRVEERAADSHVAQRPITDTIQ